MCGLGSLLGFREFWGFGEVRVQGVLGLGLSGLGIFGRLGV